TYDFIHPPTVTNLASLPSGFSDYTGLSTFGLDSSNELYFCRMGGRGDILKLVHKTVTNLPPPQLSKTSIFTDLASLTPTNGIIPYDVNVSLWANGADKRRWIALPNDGSPYGTNEQVAFSPTGEWSFPQGTVFIKNFTILTNENNPNSFRRLETRLLVLDTNSSAYGITYKWRSDQSDADLLTNSFNETLSIQTASGTRTQNYYYPSPQDCLRCHNANAHFVLGLKTRQMNGNFTYPTTGRSDNQLRTWNHLGMFNPPLIESNIPTYAQLNATNTTLPLSHRVRSYVDVNCAFCHRPGGVSQAMWDGRFDTALTNQGIVNGTVVSTLGIAGARVIRAGSIPQSIMRVRVNALDTSAMPPLAKTVVDSNTVALLDSWILSLTNAPLLENGADTNGAYILAHGQPGMNYSLQGTANFTNWPTLGNMFDQNLRYLTADMSNAPVRIYRLQLPR
ncbi:MAG: Immunoglobulin I-set domain protein, partial [Verrucomicrobiales bacterium]|nr:Immunoglobulin I-set domain protein [Verrucomicrobiales bacterium]